MIYQTIDHPKWLNDIMQVAKESYGMNPWTEEQYQSDWQNKTTQYLGAFDHQFLVGYLHFSVVDDTVEVLNLAVHPAYQRQGIAKELLTKGMDLYPATWLLEVRASNIVAQSVYQKVGFTSYHQRPNYYHDPSDDAILMKLEVKEEENGK